MTIVLRVDPINFEEEGSYMERRAVLRAIHTLATETDGIENIEAQIKLDDIISAHVEAEGEFKTEKAREKAKQEGLMKLSANDFDDLLQGLLASPVPPESADS